MSYQSAPGPQSQPQATGYTPAPPAGTYPAAPAAPATAYPAAPAPAYPAAPGYQAPPASVQLAPQPYGQYPAAYTGVKQTNTYAIVALIMGIASFLGLSVVGAIVAIALGNSASKTIAQTGEPGANYAKAGVALGWVNIALTAVVLILAIILIALLPGYIRCLG